MKKDNIEETYSKLESYTKIPPPELWDNIEARLHPKKKRRALFLIWGSAAAVLLVFVGYLISGNLGVSDNPKQNVVDTKFDIENPVLNDSILDRKTLNGQEAIVLEDSITETQNSKINQVVDATLKSDDSKSETINGYPKEKHKSKNRLKIEESQNKKALNTIYAQAREESSKGNTKVFPVLNLEKANEIISGSSSINAVVINDSIFKINKQTIQDDLLELIAENSVENDSIPTKENEFLKWSIEVAGGLTNTASESNIQGVSVNTSSQNDFVYNVKVGFALTDRLMVKSGIGRNILGQTLDNVNYINSDAVLINGGAPIFVNNESIVFLPIGDSVVDITPNSPSSINEGTLVQRLSYIQVPLELNYNLLSKNTINLSLGVGGNVNFLTENEALLNNTGIGENIGADKTIFGVTLNTNMSYKLSKNINLFLEPCYNYFEKALNNNSQNFKNTQLRVLFGLQYQL